MSERDRKDDASDDEEKRDPSPNAAPDAVRDPNAKTDGKPGQAPEGGEADPGAG